MAKYSVKYDITGDEVIKTLTFMGKDYSETWKHKYTTACYVIDDLIIKDYPNLPEEIHEIIQYITTIEDDEIMGELLRLTEYEQKEYIKELKERSSIVYQHKGVNIYSLKVADPIVDNLDYFTIVDVDIRYFPTVGEAVNTIDKDRETLAK